MAKRMNYVNNKKFTKDIIEFVKARTEDDTITLRIHPAGEYIGHCIMEICNNLAKKANFVNYTYKEEMIADGIENCIKAAMNFNCEKSSNAFGYFTQIAFNAFIRRIQKEKKQAVRKLQLLSDPKALNDIISKQFDDGVPGSEHEGNVQHFIDQMQATLVETGQLIELHQRALPKKKDKQIIESSISKYFQEDCSWL